MAAGEGELVGRGNGWGEKKGTSAAKDGESAGRGNGRHRGGVEEIFFIKLGEGGVLE